MGGPNPDVADLWQAHRNRKFPPRLRDAEVGDVDVVLLDACIAGCVGTWLSNGGHLDLERSQTLATCLEDLEQSSPYSPMPRASSTFSGYGSLPPPCSQGLHP